MKKYARSRFVPKYGHVSICKISHKDELRKPDIDLTGIEDNINDDPETTNERVENVNSPFKNLHGPFPWIGLTWPNKAETGNRLLLTTGK